MAREPGARRAGGKDKPGRKTKPPRPKTARGKTARAKKTSPHEAAGNGAPRGQDRRELRTRLHEALLAQIATIGWRDLSYAQVVEAAGMPLATAYRLYRSKIGVLRGLIADIDQRLLGGLEADPLDGTARDKLFDLTMRRLDLQQANKTALDVLLRDLRRSPAEALCVAGRLDRSMALMLDLTGISTSGIRGILRVKGLSGLYLLVLRTWLKDESTDSATTMALLDKRLNQAERLFGLRRHRGGHSN